MIGSGIYVKWLIQRVHSSSGFRDLSGVSKPYLCHSGCLHQNLTEDMYNILRTVEWFESTCIKNEHFLYLGADPRKNDFESF